MRKFAVYVFFAVMLNFVGMPRYCSADDTVRLNFSLEWRNGTFAECTNPLCRLLSEILSACSKDIENLQHRSNEKSSAADININITISHKRSLRESFTSSWESFTSLFRRTPASAPAMSAQENTAANKAEKPREPKKYTWLEKFKFLDKTALIKIVSNDIIRDDDYFTKDGLTFCRIYPNGSPANYGFADIGSIRGKLHELYDGELSINSISSFSFRSKGGNFDSIVDSALLSLESLKLASSDNDIPQDPPENYGQTQYFFRTNRDGVYLVAVRGTRERFYIAAGDSVYSRGKLGEIFHDRQIIEYDRDSGRMTLRLLTPNNQLTDKDINVCMEIFMSQVLQKCEQTDAAHW